MLSSLGQVSWPSYTLTELGNSLYPSGINTAGTICGNRSQPGQAWYKTSSGSVTNVPLLASGTYNVVSGISSNASPNIIIGWGDGTGAYTSKSAIIYPIGGTPAVVPGIGNSTWALTEAYGVSKDGEYICGFSLGKYNGWTYSTGGGLAELTAPNVTSHVSHANAINNGGVVEGAANWPNGGSITTFLASKYDAGWTQFGTHPTSSSVFAMNNSKRGTGGISPASESRSSVVYPLNSGERAFFVTGLGAITLLGDSGDDSCGLGINADDVVVGTVDLGDSVHHAFIWSSTDGFADLNDLVSSLPANVTLVEATAINDDGIVVGYGLEFPTSGPVRPFGFKLTP